jgi:glycosyltransferase involved in cell wall biosynthesis
VISVLHVINWFHVGGVERQLMRLLRGYDRNRFHMDVCLIGSEPGPLAEEARKTGAEILFCPKSPNLQAFARRFAEILRGKDYQVVHSHFEPWSGPILRGANRMGVPVRIAQLHSLKPFPSDSRTNIRSRMGKAVLSIWGRHWIRLHATHVLAVSRSVQQQRWSFEKGVPVVLWTGGVDTERFSPRIPPRSMADHTAPIVISVTTMRPAKHVDVLLHAFRQVRASINNAKLLLIGAGPSEPEIRRLARELMLEDCVDFVGLRYDVAELLGSADVFVSCSEEEGLPTALLEAQAAGLPVVASDIGPHRDALAHELHAYLFPCNSNKIAAGKILNILGDLELRRRLGQAARNHVLKHFSATAMIERLQDYYVKWLTASEGDNTDRHLRSPG